MGNCDTDNLVELAADGVMAIDDDEDEVMIDAPVYKLIVTRH